MGKRGVDKTAKPLKSFSVPLPFREGAIRTPPVRRLLQSVGGQGACGLKHFRCEICEPEHRAGGLSAELPAAEGSECDKA